MRRLFHFNQGGSKETTGNNCEKPPRFPNYFFSTREFKRRARLNIKLLKILYPTIHSKKSCQFL